MKRTNTMRILSMVFMMLLLAAWPLALQASAQPELSLEKSVFTTGEKILVRYTADMNWPSDAWIGIIPSSVSHGSEELNDQYDITYQYIEHHVQGVMVFAAPEPGHWDMRMHDTDDNGREIASVSFTVK